MFTRTMDSNVIKSSMFKALSTADLDNALRRVNIEEKSFYDILPWNCLPRSLTYFPTIYIINEDNSFSSGSHWVVLFKPSKTSLLEYFDSFGRKPRMELVENSNFIFNSTAIQNIFSSLCGHYCLLFIWFRLKLHLSMNDFVERMKSLSDESVLNLSMNIFFNPRSYNYKKGITQEWDSQ